MATVQSTKPLTARTVEVMKPGGKDKSDSAENAGLWVTCGATGVKTFFYRHKREQNRDGTLYSIVSSSSKVPDFSETYYGRLPIPIPEET